MNVIVHQCVLVYGGAMLFACCADQTQIDETIRVVSENIRLSISSLKDVVRPTGYNQTCKSQEGFLKIGQGMMNLHPAHTWINVLFGEI